MRILLCMLLLATSRSLAEDAGRTLELNLWDTPPTGTLPDAGPGRDDGTGRIRGIGIPAMTVHFPAAGTGGNRRAIIACPGGGYSHLANFAVGNGTIAAFTPKNVVVVVLKYRVSPPSPKDRVAADALADGKRAVRLVRQHAAEWGIDPRQIGVVGWSAGANLTLNLATHFDAGNAQDTDPVERQSCRPDFVAMLCPWPGGKTIDAYPVAPDAPPAFIASAHDDKTAPTSFAEAIAAGYEKAGARHRLWLIDFGGHGAFSVASRGEGSHWSEQFWDWLQEPVP